MNMDDDNSLKKIDLIKNSVTYNEDRHDNLIWRLHWATPLPIPLIVAAPTSTDLHLFILYWVLFYVVVAISGKTPLGFLHYLYVKCLPRTLSPRRFTDRRNENDSIKMN